MKKKRFSLNAWILGGAAAGLFLGMFLRLSPGTPGTSLVLGACAVAGGVFIGLLKMILMPLVVLSISSGIANLADHARMTRVWILTLLFFATTTMFSVAVSMSAMNAFRPGAGMDVGIFKSEMASFHAEGLSVGQFFVKFLSGLFINPFQALAETQVLPAVVFAILFGAALVAAGEKSRQLRVLLSEAMAVVMTMVEWIMWLAPVGILALLAQLVATQDLRLFGSLGTFAAVVIGATLFHGLVTLPGVLWVLTRIGPFRFFQGVREALITAFATSSSSATMPVTMRCLNENLKVDKNIGGFVVPLGATVNMDGTAIYESAAALFVANLVGIELNFTQQLIVFFTAMLAAVGAPGIPSAGMVTMVMVLQAVGLPAEAVAILIPIDRPLDAIRTAVNVEGDCVGSCIVQRWAGGPRQNGKIEP
ncbi:MAG: dicarboxylate/amino acid:cation symporter [Candidatus Omnitrophota bacterium]|nr:dicarboxylate/amino acid:cation symporter [Candidatus Omnitrophota bacterium]MDZ4242633.1 dicarboxylate/amino acid:cation symporter [Candidatus Omnitrophota bacterium]